MISRGWLLDLYVHEDSLVLWFRLCSGKLLRLTDSFSFHFYAQGPKPALRTLEKKLALYIRHTAWTRRIEFWSGETIPVLEITLRSLEKLPEVQRFLSAGPEVSPSITATWVSPSIMPGRRAFSPYVPVKSNGKGLP